MYGVVFPGSPTGNEYKAEPRACASNRSRRTFSSECLTLAFSILDRSCFPFPFTCSVAVARARGRRLLDFREDASDCRSNFLSPPSLHLSPPLFLVPHPAEELGNLHILETRAPASQSVCAFVRSIPPETYLTCKGRKNGKGSERFCTVCLFYGMFPLPASLPSSPICYAGSSITPPQ